MDNLDAFTRAYIEAALWTECNPDNEEMSEKGEDDFAPETIANMIETCAHFQRDYLGLLKQAYATPMRTASGEAEYTESQAGHDLWLNRNGHGAGFWDRGLGEIGDKLAAVCGFRTKYDQVDLYLGDDGKIYQS